MHQMVRSEVDVAGNGGVGSAAASGDPRSRLQTYARLAGLLYLVVFVCGVFSELGVRSKLIADGDPTATAANVTASEGLFRLGLVSDLVMLLADVGVAVLLYALLRHVDRTLAMLAAAFRLVMVAVIGAALIAYAGALLALAGDTDLTSAFSPAQVDALATLALEAHAFGYLIALTFFALHVLLLGYLLLRSRFVPRALPVLLGLAAVGYLADSLAFFLVPSYDGTLSPALLAPAFVAELALPLWLLVRGVDFEAWNRRVAT
jgi:hypothetical protein